MAEGNEARYNSSQLVNQNSSPLNTDREDVIHTVSNQTDRTEGDLRQLINHSSDRREVNVFNIYGNQNVQVESGQTPSTRGSPLYAPNILANIASSTRNILATEGRYIETKAFGDAVRKLRVSGKILITGSHGAGKTALGRHLLSSEPERTPLLMTNPDDWNLLPRPLNWGNISKTQKYAVLIDDIVGTIKPNEDLMDRWESMFPIIQPMIDSGQIVVIACTRSTISNAFSGRNNFWNFFKRSVIDIDAYELSAYQKKEIFNCITKNRHRFSREEINKLTEISITRGFPGCCKYFDENRQVIKSGLNFFQNPMAWLDEEIETMFDRKPYDYSFLILILYQLAGKIPQFHDYAEIQSLDAVREFQALAGKIPSIELGKSAKSLAGTFVIDQEGSYAFSNQLVADAVARSFLSKFPENGIELCPPHILIEYTCLPPVKHDDALVVPVIKTALARRLTRELRGKNFEYILNHEAFQNESFLSFIKTEGFLSEFDSTNKISWDIAHEFRLAFDITPLLNQWKYFRPTSKTIFTYNSKLAVIIMKGLGYFSRLLLRGLIETNELDERIVDELIPCFCLVGDTVALKVLKKNNYTPNKTSLIACAAAKKESIEILKYIWKKTSQNVSPKDLCLMLRMTLQLGRSDSSKFLMQQLSKYDDGEIFTLLFVQILLQCHGKHGGRFKKSEKDIILEYDYGRTTNRRLDWFSYLPLDEFLEILSWRLQESVLPTIIFIAAGTNVPYAMKRLLDINNSLITVRSRSSQTLLHIACEAGSVEMVDHLLREGIDSDSRDEKGFIALHYAVSSHFDPAEKIRLLVSNGCDLNILTESAKSVLHVASSNGSDSGLNELLQICRQDLVNAKDKDGNTPLHLASECSYKMFGYRLDKCTQKPYVNCVASLIAHGADVNLKNKQKNTSLHLAALAFSEEIMEILINAGADINEKGNDGSPPLFQIALSVQFLLQKGADFQIKNDAGNTILHELHEFRNILFNEEIYDAMMLLKDKNANMNVQNNAGQTCLHVAVEKSFSSFEHFEVCQVDENITDFRGQTVHHYLPALSLYQILGFGDVLRMEMTNVLDVNGEGAIHLCAQKGHHLSLACLIEKGADIDFVNSTQETALHLATKKGFWKSMRILLTHKASINVSDMNRETPLLIASGQPGFADKVKLLLESGAVINCQDINSLTPLHRAVRRNLTDVVKVLLNHDCTGHTIKDNQGNTPLQIACSRDNFDMISALVVNDEDLTIKDEQGNTPIHLLVSKNKMQMATYLKTNGMEVSNIPSFMVKMLSQRRQNRLRDGHGPNASWLSLFVPNKMLTKKKTKVKRKRRLMKQIIMKQPEDSPDSLSLLSDDDSDSCERKTFDVSEDCKALLVKPLEITTSMIHRLTDVNIKNNQGDTPLHLAAFSGSWKIVKVLLDKGAQQTGNQKEETPLHMAVYRDHIMAVKLLLNSGGDRGKKDIVGNTPLHIAAELGHMNVLVLLLGIPSPLGVKHLKKMFKQDIGKRIHSINVNISDVIGNFDLESQNNLGETLLHVAVRGGWVKIVKGLIMLGASLCTRNANGQNAYEIALQQKQKKMLFCRQYERIKFMLKSASDESRERIAPDY